MNAGAKGRRLGAFLVAGISFSGCAPDRGAPATTSVELAPLPASEPERTWTSRALVPADGVVDSFGFSVSISGDTLVVGAPLANAAYVFVRADAAWHEQAKLEAPAEAVDEGFAWSVAVSGDTIVVGATDVNGPAGDSQGAAYVFVRSGVTWNPTQTLRWDSSKEWDHFGNSLALEGDTLVVGAMYAWLGTNGSEGAAYVFRRAGATFEPVTRLVASDAYPPAHFGVSVAISGDTALVGAEWASFSGAVYFYSGASWAEQQIRHDGPLPEANLGHSVALDGDIAVFGEPHAWGFGGSGRMHGSALVYGRSVDGFSPLSENLFADDGESLDEFGTSAAVSGDTVMIGAPFADTVYVFHPRTGTAVVQKLRGPNGEPYFGSALAFDGEQAVIGATQLGEDDVPIAGPRGAFVAALLSTDGDECTRNAECISGICSAGRCCDRECTGACNSCASSTCKSLAGMPGVPSCAPYLCGEAGGDCPTECATHAGCVETHYCRNERCVERRGNGASCNESRECASGRCVGDVCAGTLSDGARCANASDCRSGYCVDGVCCEDACNGQCEACDLDGDARGVCSPVSGAPHGDRPACDAVDAVCGGECHVEERARCLYPASETLCDPKCQDGMLTESVCNGGGACAEIAPVSCENYACGDNGACRTGCELPEHCAEGATCRNERCRDGSSCLDEVTSQGADGTTTGCGNYRCDDESGICRTRCGSVDDCANALVCDDGQCVPPPAPVPPPSGCDSCSVHRPTDGTAWSLLAALAALAAVVRARRRSRRSHAFEVVGAL